MHFFLILRWHADYQYLIDNMSSSQRFFLPIIYSHRKLLDWILDISNFVETREVCSYHVRLSQLVMRIRDLGRELLLILCQ